MDVLRGAASRPSSRRMASFTRPAAWVMAAKGQADVASTKCRRPSVRSTVIEHRESTPRRGPFTSMSRSVTRRIRCVNRRSAKESRRSAYSRRASTVSGRPTRIRNSTGMSTSDPLGSHFFRCRLRPAGIQGKLCARIGQLVHWLVGARRGATERKPFRVNATLSF